MNSKSAIAFLVFSCIALHGGVHAQDVVVAPDPPEQLRLIHEPTACDYLNGGLGTTDWDADGINNCSDNCVFDRNKDQKDKDKDGVGDKCEWRELADEEWESTGRHQRETATEPADLSRLVRDSSNILLVKFAKGGGVPEDNFSLSRHYEVEIVRELKGRASRLVQSVYSGIWVWVPGPGVREVNDANSDREYLVFLKNGKLRRWKEPLVWSADMRNGKPYTETHYFGYEVTDTRYGVLGVSRARIEELEKLIQRVRKH